LSFYEIELKKVQAYVEDKQGELGSDRFAPAGFKLKWNLTNPEIAYLFKALVAAGHLTTQNGNKPSHVDLAKFINRNFSSVIGQPISQNTLATAMSEAKLLPEDTLKMFQKLARLTNL
jgi:hypothetical protein